MISRFFIDHPVFANVIALVTILLGAIALYGLPVEQYPQITPPHGHGARDLSRSQRTSR